jgi:hypothetical protein
MSILLAAAPKSGSGFDAAWFIGTAITVIGLVIAYIAIRRQVTAAVAANNAVARYVLRDLDETIAELGKSHSELVAAKSQNSRDQARLSLQNWRELALTITGLLDGIAGAQAAQEAKIQAVAEALRLGADSAQKGIRDLVGPTGQSVDYKLKSVTESVDSATAEVIELGGRLKATLARPRSGRVSWPARDLFGPPRPRFHLDRRRDRGVAAPMRANH